MKSNAVVPCDALCVCALTLSTVGQAETRFILLFPVRLSTLILKICLSALVAFGKETTCLFLGMLFAGVAAVLVTCLAAVTNIWTTNLGHGHSVWWQGSHLPRNLRWEITLHLESESRDQGGLMLGSLPPFHSVQDPMGPFSLQNGVGHTMWDISSVSLV